jgi:hypothetical protein
MPQRARKAKPDAAPPPREGRDGRPRPAGGVPAHANTRGVRGGGLRGPAPRPAGWPLEGPCRPGVRGRRSSGLRWHGRDGTRLSPPPSILRAQTGRFRGADFPQRCPFGEGIGVCRRPPAASQPAGPARSQGRAGGLVAHGMRRRWRKQNPAVRKSGAAGIPLAWQPPGADPGGKSPASARVNGKGPQAPRRHGSRGRGRRRGRRRCRPILSRVQSDGSGGDGQRQSKVRARRITSLMRFVSCRLALFHREKPHGCTLVRASVLSP